MRRLRMQHTCGGGEEVDDDRKEDQGTDWHTVTASGLRIE